MILAVDVHYFRKNAVAAGVLFQNWSDAKPLKELVVPVPLFAEYEPGKFYRRELPCVLVLLKRIKSLPEHIVIDGHVYLDDARKPGLGKYLYDALQGKAAIIGVAKSPFKSTPADAAIFRSKSKRPLYVTATGVDEHTAKGFIRQMHGPYRLPTLLKRADELCRSYNVDFKKNVKCHKLNG